MYREDYNVVIPKFNEVKVSIDELGAVSGKLDVKTGHDNAVIINNAIRSLSENGGGTVIVPAGIWACAPIRILSGINLHLESQCCNRSFVYLFFVSCDSNNRISCDPTLCNDSTCNVTNT